jgi:DNA-directed RNA polymerase specialized sigma24 family protein
MPNLTLTMTNRALIRDRVTEAEKFQIADPATLIMLRIRHGDSAAVRELFDSHSRPLLDFACWLVDDQDAAERLVQDAFLEIYRSRKGPMPKLPLVAHLHRLVARLSIAHLRAGAPSEASVGDGPLAGFSPEKKAVLFLSRLQSIGLSDIAEALDMSIIDVKRQLCDATREMRDRVAEPRAI